MHERELVNEVLEKFFPDECDLAGPTNVRKIAGGNAEVVRAEYGANLDLTQVIAILASVAGVINNALSIYKNWEGAKPPDKGELISATAESAGKASAAVGPDEMEKIYEYVLRRLQEGAARGQTAPAEEEKPVDEK